MIWKRLRRLRGDRGYTLVELLVVLAIFTTVVTALVSLFTSGAKAELDMNRRFEAQQNARLALDRMRRELHCASGITATPNTAVSSITVTLPSQCPSCRRGHALGRLRHESRLGQPVPRTAYGE